MNMNIDDGYEDYGTIDLDSASERLLSEEVSEAALAAGVGNIPLQTKAQVVDYYRATFPEKKWRAQLTTDLIQANGLANDKKTRNTISRTLQGTRLDSAPRDKNVLDRFKQLGSTLPPEFIPPAGARVKITAKLVFSGQKGKKNEVRKKFEVLLDQEEAIELLNGNIDVVIEEYGINPGDVESCEIESIEIEFFK